MSITDIIVTFFIIFVCLNRKCTILIFCFSYVYDAFSGFLLLFSCAHAQSPMTLEMIVFTVCQNLKSHGQTFYSAARVVVF